MAMTRAQLVVWVLIGALLCLGSLVLSQLRAPDAPSTPTASLAQVDDVAAEADATPAEPPAPAPTVQAEAAQPESVPEFPFPTGELTQKPRAEAGAVDAADLAAVPVEAIPGIEEALTSDDLAEVALLPTLSDSDPDGADSTALVPLSSVAAEQATAAPSSEIATLYVAAETLNVRATPSTDGRVLQKVPLGFAVSVRERQDGWIAFEMRDGTIGWLRTDYLSASKPAPATAGTAVRGQPLNLM
jgi:hypothetical protein